MNTRTIPSLTVMALQSARDFLQKTRSTVAVAESCTGGLLSELLTRDAGSSAFFLAGLVVYSNAAKTRFLRVSASALKRRGAVSACTASRMADQVRKITRADFGIGITGIAGPCGGTRAKPVGTVYIALSAQSHTHCSAYRFRGNRTQIRWQAVEASLKLLIDHALLCRGPVTR